MMVSSQRTYKKYHESWCILYIMIMYEVGTPVLLSSPMMMSWLQFIFNIWNVNFTLRQPKKVFKHVHYFSQGWIPQQFVLFSFYHSCVFKIQIPRHAAYIIHHDIIIAPITHSSMRHLSTIMLCKNHCINLSRHKSSDTPIPPGKWEWNIYSQHHYGEQEIKR